MHVHCNVVCSVQFGIWQCAFKVFLECFVHCVFECFLQCVQCLVCIENSVYIEMQYTACNLECFVQCV